MAGFAKYIGMCRIRSPFASPMVHCQVSAPASFSTYQDVSKTVYDQEGIRPFWAELGNCERVD